MKLLAAALGGLSLVISVAFAISALFLRIELKRRFLMLALAYFLLALVILSIRFVLVRIQRATRKKHLNPTPAPETSTGARMEPSPPLVEPLGNPSSRDGAVLIFVLLVVSLVVTLVVQTQVTAHSRLRLERAELQATQLRTSASDAVHQALRQLADDTNLSVDHTNEPWASPREIVAPSGIATMLKVTDENRFYDLNNLSLEKKPGARDPAEIAMDIMTVCGDFTPVDRVDALVNWIDNDDSGYAESRYYREEDPAYEAANRVLYTWNELLWVKGFSRPMFERHGRTSIRGAFQGELLDTLTIIPVERTSPHPVNLNTANKDVLLGVLGFGQEDLVRAILMMRTLRPIVSLNDLAPLVTNPELFEQFKPYLSTRSDFFRIEARSYSEGQVEQLRVLARRDTEGNVDVLQWVF